MKTKIIAFAGSKQSGKSTCAKFLHGYQMRSYRCIDDFAITDDGDFLVKTRVVDDDGKVNDKNYVSLDINRTDVDFAEWAIREMWPFVKKYSFASSLKSIAVNLFNVPSECVYKTEEQKRKTIDHLRWENMPGVITCPELWDHMHPDGESEYGVTYHKPGPMTAREFLQYFGTDVCRKMYENVWIDRCIKDVQEEGSLLAVIDDCRFKNEIEAIQNAGGKVIGLTRQPHKDNHNSEKEISENWNLLDAVIDNSKMSINEMCQSIVKHIDDWGWMGQVVKTENKNKPNKLHTIKVK
jgi:hypothetical protein